VAETTQSIAKGKEIYHSTFQIGGEPMKRKWLIFGVIVTLVAIMFVFTLVACPGKKTAGKRIQGPAHKEVSEQTDSHWYLVEE
jgi:hypothetical protein